MRVLFRLIWQFIFFATLVGCAGQTRVFQDSITAVWQGDKFNDVARTTPMLPGYGYLRMHGTGGAILMVWTFLDKDPKSDLPIFIWQSGGGEIMKMQDGRIVGSQGFEGDWLTARYEGAPNWTQVLENTKQNSYNYHRVVDFKSKYEFGKTQHITLTRVPQPVGHALAAVQQPDIMWFEERVLGQSFPPNIYGVVPNWNNSGQAKVAYTWHCFSAKACKGFQVWTTVDQDYLKSAKP